MSDQRYQNHRASRQQLGLTPIQIKDKKQVKAELAAYSADLNSTETLKPLTWQEVEEVDMLFGGAQYRKKIYGHLAAADAVKTYDCKITRRTYHQAVAGPLAKVYIDEALRLARQASGRYQRESETIELHTGSGAITHALIKANARLKFTVDINRAILDWAKGNLKKLGCEIGSTSWVNQDALEFIDTIMNEGWEFDLAIADPPWEGEFSLSDAFSVMSPNGAKIVRRLLQCSRVVGLKAPGTIPDQAAFVLGDEVGAKVTSLVCYYEDGPKRYSEKMLLFLNKEAARQIKLNKHQIMEREIKLNGIK